jgi:hypothetical protein
VDLAERFVDAARERYATVGAGTELLPTVLAQACVQVLPIAGAGLSLTDGLRIPLGSSDPAAARAEQLQTTLGEGPCLAVTESGQPHVYDLAAIAATWPVFHQELVIQSPYRSIASFPLITPRQRRFGALDLYSTDPRGRAFTSLINLRSSIVGPIALILFDTTGTDADRNVPIQAWMNNSPAARRLNVWVAVGMMIEHTHLSSMNALDLLRAYSYAHDTTLDDTADRMTTRHLRPSAVLAA